MSQMDHAVAAMCLGRPVWIPDVRGTDEGSTTHLGLVPPVGEGERGTPMAEPRFHVRIDCRTSTFVLCGDLDRASADRLRETLAAIPTSTITLDLSGLRSLDDAGVACLAAAAQHHRQVVLTGARDEHRALLDIASQRPEFEIRATIWRDRPASRAGEPAG